MGRFKPYIIKRTLKKYKFFVILFLLFLIVLFLGFRKFQDDASKIQGNYINNLSKKTNFKNCEEIINLNLKTISKNKYVNIDNYKKFKNNCIKDFDIAKISFNKDVCSLIVNSSNKQNLKKYFLKLDNYESVRNKCISKYLNLKFSDKKGLNKPLLFDLKGPESVRFKDKFLVNLSVFNNTDKLKNIIVQYSSKRLAISKKRVELQIDANSFKNLDLEIENNANSGIIDLNISFISDSGKLIEKQELRTKILKSPDYTYTDYRYGKTLAGNSFVDFDFDINENINKENSKVEVLFYNDSLAKIGDIFSSLEKNKIESSFYNLVLLNSAFNLEKISDVELIKTGYHKKYLSSRGDYFTSDLKKYITDSGMFSFRKNTNIADFIISAHNYTYFVKTGVKTYDLKKLKQNLYYYINDSEVSIENKLNVMMILSEVDKKIDLRFIDNEKVKTRHDLITYTYSLFKTGPVINDDLIRINIDKIKKILNSDMKKYGYYSQYTDKLLFLNFLLDYKYYDKNYLSKLFDDLYKKDFNKINSSFLDKGLSIRALQKKYHLYENNDKSKYGFMLGLSRNTENVFWLGGLKNSYERFDYKLGDLLSLGDKKLEFRTKKLLGKDINVNVSFKGEYKNLKDIIKDNKNVVLLREFYKKDQNGKYILHRSNNFDLDSEYKIVNKIRFIDKRPRKNIVVKDYLPSNFEFIEILDENKKHNSFVKTDDYLEYQFGSYWGQDIDLSYIVKVKNIGTFVDPGFNVYMMFDDSTYGVSQVKYLNSIK